MKEQEIMEVKAEEKDIDLEIVEIEDKIAPRNWYVYAIL